MILTGQKLSINLTPCYMSNQSHSQRHPDVPLWGKLTESALTFFNIGQETLPADLIHAYGIVKFCAASTQLEQGKLPADIAEAIMLSAQKLRTGDLDNQFPISIWQSGSGTQSHMNVNEVLANLATQTLHHNTTVHPNDHCNLGQSTNDTFPTALHIACVLILKNRLLPAIAELQQSFNRYARRWQDYVKTGRTHLQDATPLSLGQEFSAYVSHLSQGYQHLNSALPDLLALTMGGTAVGTGLNSDEDFAEQFCQKVSDITGCSFTPSQNFFASQAAHDAIARLSGCLNSLATSLNKIASDLRLMASGPHCGLAEIKLPANEPGSSIMPGKVNPSQCEMLNMVCAQVMGNHSTITIANAQGQFQLNTFKPVIALNILQSLNLLADAINSFDQYCVQGIQANKEKLAETMEKSLMLITALTPVIGYDKAAEVIRYAEQQNLTLRQAVIQLGVMSGKEFEQLIKSESMIHPSSSN